MPKLRLTHAASPTSPALPPIVVIGGVQYARDVNQPSVQMVTELAKSRCVLYLYTESQGSILKAVRERGLHLDRRLAVRTVFGRMRPRRISENLYVAPVRGLAAVLPLSWPELVRRRNLRLMARLINDWLTDQGAIEAQLLFYWWFLPELLELVPHSSAIYDCIDEHSSYASGSQVSRTRGIELEEDLIARVNATFVVSPGLLASRQHSARDIRILPNGFDLDRLAAVSAGSSAKRNADRPVIGYAGGIGPRIDWILVGDLAVRRPDWDFVFAGGDSDKAPPHISSLTNVRFDGALPYQEMLEAIATFDVCVIPFVVSDFTEGNSFMKLLDYFALGRPVVATPLPDTNLGERAEHALTLASGVDAWEAAIAAHLTADWQSGENVFFDDYVRERSTAARADVLAQALTMS